MPSVGAGEGGVAPGRSAGNTGAARGALHTPYCHTDGGAAGICGPWVNILKYPLHTALFFEDLQYIWPPCPIPLLRETHLSSCSTLIEYRLAKVDTLYNISNIVTKHWRAMVTQDNYLHEVFEEPPLIAYKRSKNIKDQLVRAKITKQNHRTKRKQKGMKKCGKCVSCKSIKEGRTIKSTKTNWTLNREYNCKTENVVYLLECDKENCRKQYVGETERPLSERIKEHIGYARNNILHKTTGNHFNSPGHSWINMKFTVIEQVKKRDKMYREEREKHFIHLFNTYYDGINLMP